MNGYLEGEQPYSGDSLTMVIKSCFHINSYHIIHHHRRTTSHHRKHIYKKNKSNLNQERLHTSLWDPTIPSLATLSFLGRPLCGKFQRKTSFMAHVLIHRNLLGSASQITFTIGTSIVPWEENFDRIQSLRLEIRERLPKNPYSMDKTRQGS